MAGKPKRLSKVTKEFNLGLSTVVDFLQEKGFEVESNPNAKISPEMYDVLSGAFQTEKKVKEKSNSIEVKKPIKESVSIEVEKPKVESSPIDLESVKIEADKPEPLKEESLDKESSKKKTKNEDQDEKVDLEVQSEEKQEASVKEKVSKDKGELKVVGKINLDDIKKVKYK